MSLVFPILGMAIGEALSDTACSVLREDRKQFSMGVCTH
jgi:hypothetical protein